MREGGLEDTFIVALTGYDQEEVRRRCQEAGFDQHRVKPIEAPALLEIVNRCVDRHGPSLVVADEES